MSLVFQDPNDPSTEYLVEAILEACRQARQGGGAFAFASAAGVKLLLEDGTFVDFARQADFDLVIGIDAVTDSRAVGAIRTAIKSASGVRVRAFLHERHDLLFHPKLCWFRHKGGGRLVVSSGNLTVGGLRTNWEAFTVEALTVRQTREVESSWRDWTRLNAQLLVPLNDGRVRARVAKNDQWARLGDQAATRIKPRTSTARPAGDDATLQAGTLDDVVLIAEIPRSGDRWNQANFDLDNYEHFFGAKRGTQRRMLFQHVKKDGQPGHIESRPSVAVKSRNWRFELDAASGLTYPSRGRPIGVFVRVATRSFRYMLLLPSRPGYARVRSMLDKQWSGARGRVRRIRVRASELKAAWPDCKLVG